MDLVKFANAVDVMLDEDFDLDDLYVIAKYQRAKENGDVTIMALTKRTRLLSPTVMRRRIKKLVKCGVLAKTERTDDMRVRPLIDGKHMPSLIELLDPV